MSVQKNLGSSMRGLKNGSSSVITQVLWGAIAFSALALLVTWWIYPEMTYALVAEAALGAVLTMVQVLRLRAQVKEAMATRGVRYGANATVTVGLVFGIVVVLNFLSAQHFVKKDLTKIGSHSLSDQTLKVLGGLKTDVKLTLFGIPPQRDQFKALLDNYRYHSARIQVEFVDAQRERPRTELAKITAIPALQVDTGHQQLVVENITEEKITNALVKGFKDSKPVACLLQGHGEPGLDQIEPNGMSMLKERVGSNLWGIREITLLAEDKVPVDCNVVMIVGATRPFHPKEMGALQSFLDQGGRLFVAADLALDGVDSVKHLNDLIQSWGISFDRQLLLDPRTQAGRELGLVRVAMFNGEHPLGKGIRVSAVFPKPTPLKMAPAAPEGVKIQWAARSLPEALGISDWSALKNGGSISMKTANHGPFDMMATLEGNPKKGDFKPARIFVAGSAGWLTNGFIRYGLNMDLALNALNWLVNQEDGISIRPKVEENQPLIISATMGAFLSLFCKFVLPLVCFVYAAILYFRRKSL